MRPRSTPDRGAATPDLRPRVIEVPDLDVVGQTRTIADTARGLIALWLDADPAGVDVVMDYSHVDPNTVSLAAGARAEQARAEELSRQAATTWRKAARRLVHDDKLQCARRRSRSRRELRPRATVGAGPRELTIDERVSALPNASEARPGRLSGKSAVITGAAKGIGRATAVRFAAEGVRLTVTDVDQSALEELGEVLTADGAEVVTVTGDVSVAADARRMIDTGVQRYGRVDILVANAGIIPLNKITEASGDDWDHVMAIDGRGMFLTCKYAIEHMVTAGGGSIVCLSSISGLAGQSSQSTYGPAKFVASGLTKHLAVEWASEGIRVNAVAPGTIRTDRVRRLPEEPGGAAYLAEIERRHPLGRIGEPEEVASAIAFLASDDASFITGTVLPVDGGYLAQ